MVDPNEERLDPSPTYEEHLDPSPAHPPMEPVSMFGRGEFELPVELRARYLALDVSTYPTLPQKYAEDEDEPSL